MTLPTPNVPDDLQFSFLNDLDGDHTLQLQGVPDWFDASSPNLPISCQFDSAASRRLLEAYYLRFHRAHPILLPLRRWTKHLVRNYPYYLTAVMQCIGYQYESTMATKSQRDALRRMLTSQTVQSGYLVQAMLLLAITLHANSEQQAAGEILDSAIHLALDLGMNRAEFATDNNEGSQSLEESWRRTWWELYILDGMLAALNHQTYFKLNNIDSNILLPCEEVDYSTKEVSFWANYNHMDLTIALFSAFQIRITTTNSNVMRSLMTASFTHHLHIG